MKVRIKNYEILEDVKLEFVEGLNIITGESNNGKSAIFRAIEGAIFNETGDDFIQFEKDYSLVALQDKENTIVWKKPRAKNKSTVYTVNGEELTKVGRSQVDEVADVINIREIKLTSRDKEKLNFWVQMGYPFLIGKSGSQLFEFLSLSSEDDNLTEVIKEMRTDLNDIKDSIKSKEGGIDALKDIIRVEEDYLKSKEGFETTYDKILGVESKVENYKDLEILHSNLSEKKLKIRKLKDFTNDINKSINNVEPLFKNYEEIMISLRDLSLSIKEMNNKTQKIEEEKEILNGINGKIEKINIKSIENKLNRYLELKTDIEDLSVDIDSVQSIKRDVVEERDNLDKLKSKISKINIDLIEENLNKYLKLKGEIVEMRGYIDSVNSLKIDITEERKKLVSIKESIKINQEKLNEFDICPLCGADIK